MPRESRFFIGGVNSLRGYSENAVPPSNGGLAMAPGQRRAARSRWPGRSASRRSWTPGMSGPGRSTFGPRTSCCPGRRPGTGPSDLRWTYGVGARLVLPFGPLRVDLAWSDRPDFPFEGRLGNWKNLPFVVPVRHRTFVLTRMSDEPRPNEPEAPPGTRAPRRRRDDPRGAARGRRARPAARALDGRQARARLAARRSRASPCCSS